MFLLIIGIILSGVLFVVLGAQTGKDEWGDDKVTGWKINKGQIFAFLPMLICVFGLFTSIPANHVGIVYSPFGGTQEETLKEGFHGKNLFDKIYKINTEVQTTTIENLTTQTKDAQYLTSILDIKYRVNTTNAHLVFQQYRTLDNMSENLIIPTTQRALELVTTRYNVIDVLGEKRSEVYAELDKALSTEFAKYGVEYISISITDMDAGAELEAAISAEAVAKKAVETAEQDLKKAEIDAKQKAVEAQADQEAAKIEAETKKIEAQAERDAYELLNQSLTDEQLEKLWIEKWNGKLPTYYGAEGAGFMIDLGK